MRPTLIFLVTEDFYFCSHRLTLAQAARDRGFRVVVATRVVQHGDAIRSAGLDLFPIRLRRSGRHPVRELRAIAEIVQLYRRERPAIVHHVAMKPVLYGSLAAQLAGVGHVVNAIAGMGYVFSSTDRLAQVLRIPIGLAFRALLGRANTRLIVQNPDDRDAMLNRCRVQPDQIALIRGSGVDIEHFRPAPPPVGPVRVTMVARMLRDKGVVELVDAARILRSRGVLPHIVLVGAPDALNPASLSLTDLKRWTEEGCVEWVGHRDDIAHEWSQSHIAVLPSYREGLPKALLEAAACGLPLIATDVPGCRELVRHEHNGLLVPVRNAPALAAAIERLAGSPELRNRYGANGRQRVEHEFAESIVIEQTLSLYSKLLAVPSR